MLYLPEKVKLDSHQKNSLDELKRGDRKSRNLFNL